MCRTFSLEGQRRGTVWCESFVFFAVDAARRCILRRFLGTMTPLLVTHTRPLGSMASASDPAVPSRRPESAPPERQLPPGGNPLTRLTQHTQALKDDLITWVELRLELAKIEFWETVDEKANQIAVMAIAGVFAVLGGLFALLTLAFGLGWLLGHVFWGFLIVTALLLLVALVVYTAKPDLGLIPAHRKRARVDEEKVSRGPTPPR